MRRADHAAAVHTTLALAKAAAEEATARDARRQHEADDAALADRAAALQVANETLESDNAALDAALVAASRGARPRARGRGGPARVGGPGARRAGV